MTYQYECKKCSHSFDIEQKITANELKKCPKCKKNGLFRVISGNFMLKGDGWSKDNYSKSKK